MLVKVALQAYQIFGDCDCFYVQDTSCCYDCGGCIENTQGYSRHDVTKTIITVTFPNGAVYVIDKGWLPTMADLRICAADFVNILSGETPQPTDCGCDNVPALFPATTTPATPGSTGLLALPDGCYTLDYQVYAMEKVYQNVCDYTFAVEGWQVGYTIWLEVNGVWVNYTPSFEIDDDGNGTLELPGVISIITGLELRDTEGLVVSSQEIEAVECTESWVETSEEILIGQSTHATIFLCHIKTAIAGAIKKAVIKNNNCNNCLKNVTQKEAVSLLAVAVAKLDAVGHNCNCKCVDDTIKSVADIIKNVIGEC